MLPASASSKVSLNMSITFSYWIINVAPTLNMAQDVRRLTKSSPQSNAQVTSLEQPKLHFITHRLRPFLSSTNLEPSHSETCCWKSFLRRGFLNFLGNFQVPFIVSLKCGNSQIGVVNKFMTVGPSVCLTLRRFPLECGLANDIFGKLIRRLRFN